MIIMPLITVLWLYLPGVCKILVSSPIFLAVIKVSLYGENFAVELQISWGQD